MATLGRPAPVTRETGRKLVAVLVLLALIAAVYGPVGGYPFTGYDDEVVVLDNAAVRSGLTAGGVRWAFSSPAALWSPLPWLSHMAVVELFGLDPGVHHLVNVLLHALAAVILLAALGALTGSLGKSLFVAALFAVHPLHVESVAWVTERKDILSGLFWMLGLAAYIAFTRRHRTGSYLLLLASFAFGLMSKPMLVTFPFVLLLLDFWPLGRFRAPGGTATAGSLRAISSLLVEKLPLFALAAGMSAATLYTTSRGGALGALETIPFGARLANAAVSYAWYVLKTVAPTSLAVFYPHPGADVALAAFPATAFLAAATWFAWRSLLRRPSMAVGWLWFLGTLVPAIGIVQAGSAARADRYTYLPLIGLFLAVAWGLPQRLSGRRHLGPLLPLAAAAAVLGAAAVGAVQVRYWRDDETLFGRALAVTRGNWMVHGNLGVTLMEMGDLDRATLHLREAVRLNPGYELARLNLGQALSLLGRDEEAEAEFLEVLRQRPEDEKAYFCLGRHYAERGRWDEAVLSLGEAVRLNPTFAAAQESLGWALLRTGWPADANRHLREAERLRTGGR